MSQEFLFEAEYRQGQVVEFRDPLLGNTGPVEIDKVIDDRDRPLLADVRYVVRFQHDDDQFITDASHLGRVL